MPNPPLYRAIDRALSEYPMIECGDAVLLGASGGKDSTALAEYLASLKKRRNPLQFRLEALHISTEFEGVPPQGIAGLSDGRLAGRANAGFESVLALFDLWKIPVHTVNVSVLGRLKPGKKMNCWWCSTQRRTELNNFAMAHGFNKIALGHHLDDILETFLMNALDRAELSTMPPVLRYRNYPVTVIRPLCFADVAMIAEHAKRRGWFAATCTCAWQSNSRRRDAREKLALLTGGSREKKLALFEALRCVKSDYLP